MLIATDPRKPVIEMERRRRGGGRG